MPMSGNEREEPFAYSHLPPSILRQLGHCIAPFILNAEPMQSIYVVERNYENMQTHIQDYPKVKTAVKYYCSHKGKTFKCIPEVDIPMD